LGGVRGGLILMDLRQPPPNLPQAWGRNKRILQEALMLRITIPSPFGRGLG